MAIACCTCGSERASASTAATEEFCSAHPSMYSTRPCTVTHKVVPGKRSGPAIALRNASAMSRS
jgi:hypothetical protein